jgi:hypothetical protein
LGDRTPQIPDRLDGGVLLALDERLGIKAQQRVVLWSPIGA